MLTNCQQLKLRSPRDDKRNRTDVANTEQILCLIHSIPSKMAEHLKNAEEEADREGWISADEVERMLWVDN